MADPITIALMAEGLRKSHVSGNIMRDQQEAAAEKAEKRSKDQEAKNLMIRQQEAMRSKRTQQETVTKSPFANKKKGTMRQQFTIGGGGSGSGTNY
jgi:preprotein translocase subunit SecF